MKSKIIQFANKHIRRKCPSVEFMNVIANYLSFQYKTERDGVVETRVERKVVITSDDQDGIDHDAVSMGCIYRCVAEISN